jgi:hypothetical protein
MVSRSLIVRAVAAVAAVAVALIACGRADPSPSTPPPAPVTVDAAVAMAPLPPPGTATGTRAVRWRVPLVLVAAAQLELDWRAPDGATEVGLTLPLTGPPGGFDCAPLQAALAAEIERTWPRTVRPSRSKQLVISATSDARNPDVFHAMDCVRATVGGRDLYPDAMLATQ